MCSLYGYDTLDEYYGKYFKNIHDVKMVFVKENTKSKLHVYRLNVMKDNIDIQNVEDIVIIQSNKDENETFRTFYKKISMPFNVRKIKAIQREKDTEIKIYGCG